MIRYKSAKYTIEQPLLIGGTLAGADPGLLAAYRAYGLPLGEAFQLRDDVLGVFGDPWQTGKPAGDDLREGKRTVLVAETLRAATPAQARVGAAPARPARTWTPHGVDTLREIIVETGALDAVERLIGELVDAGAGRPGTPGTSRSRPATSWTPWSTPPPTGRREDAASRLAGAGPTDHVVVVGAGLAGLSAALRLAGAGRRVTVLEREAGAGRAGRPGASRRRPTAAATGSTPARPC